MKRPLTRNSKILLYFWIIILITIIGSIAAPNFAQQVKIGTLTTEEADILIHAELKHLLDLNPQAVLVRTGLILKEQPRMGSNQIPLLRFDVSNAEAVPGQPLGDLNLKNIPIDTWAPWLDNFLDNKCQFIKIDELNNASAKGRVANLGIAAMEACPFVSKNGEFLGGMFLSFPKNVSISIDLDYVEKTTKQSAEKISQYLLLRPNPRYR